MQEAYFARDLEDRTFDFEACSKCNHRYFLPIGLDISELTIQNKKVRNQHMLKMTAWNILSSSHRLSKPRLIGHITQQLAYMCSRLNCLSRLDGVGCIKCMQICKKYREKNSYARPMFGGDMNCTCDFCACMCTSLYYCGQFTKLAIYS